MDETLEDIRMRIDGNFVLGLAGTALILIVSAVPMTVRADKSADQSLAIANAAIVSATPNTDGVFEVQENGDILHLQSGLRCPALFLNVAFRHAFIFSGSQPGIDVGCDYGRSDPDGYAISKFTIYATKTNGTLDEVFAGVQQEIAKANPNAEHIGPALEVKTEGGGLVECDSKFGDFRSVEYVVNRNGIPYLSDVIVAIRSGWIIKVRATFSLEVYIRDAPQGTDQAVDPIGDLAGPSIAFLAAIDTIETPETDRGDCGTSTK